MAETEGTLQTTVPSALTTSPPAPGPRLAALPGSTLKPGLAEVFASTRFWPVDKKCRKEQSRSPEHLSARVPGPEKPARSRSPRWAQAELWLPGSCALGTPHYLRSHPRGSRGSSGCLTPFHFAARGRGATSSLASQIPQPSPAAVAGCGVSI